VSHSDDANLKVIISRIQQRRGLKQELPQPLRPGEIGFATDSRQVYIGADTADATSNTYNKQVVFETTQNAQDLTKSLANSQIVKFEVPHIRFPKGSGNFNSATKQISWNPTTSSTYTVSDGTTATRTVFPANVTAPTSPLVSSINQNATNSTFNAENLTVTIGGKLQTGDDDGTGATVNAAFDYNFISGSGPASDHIINFRSAPANSQDVSITYYGNTHVVALLTTTVGVTNGATTTGFYANKGIQDWQKLDHNNIFVNGEVGTGYIGLASKHIDVVGTGSGIANIASITVGNVIAAKNPSDVSYYGGSATYDASKYSGTFVTSTVAGTEITFTSGTTVLGLAHQGSNPTNGSYEYVYIEGLNAAGITEAGYLHQKILPIKNTTDVATASFIVDTPANAFTVARAVTSTGSGATLTITGNVDGLAIGNYVDFAGTNATEFTSNPYAITAVTGTTFTVANTGSTVTGDKADNLTVVPFNNASRTNVVVTSAKNGLTTAQNITFSTAVGTVTPAGTSTPVINAGANTFEVASGDVAETVTGTFSPVLTAITANVGVTPAVTIRLAPASGDKTLNSAVADINAHGNWIKASLIPGSTDTTYVRSSDQTEYVLFNDPNDGIDSWGNLGINLALADTLAVGSQHKYLKSTKTVKAKFENWLKLLTAEHEPNVLSTVYMNDQYESGNPFPTYNLDINSTTGEIDFDGHEEAGNFSELVNKLYFEKTNANIKGLTTIKTNIELLTNEATAASSATAEYSEPNSITLVTAGESPVSSLGTDSTIIDTMMIDYVIDARMSGGLFYNKIGTLQYTANPNADAGAGTVIIQDVGTEYGDSGVTINDGVQFTAGIASGTVTVNSNVSISPTPGNVTMKYITRRWKSF